MEQSMRQRDCQMDNLKCLLIFSVVLGHMLELFMSGSPGGKLLYLVIYSFHMPLFAFVTGVFARYHPEKIRNNMVYPYLVFQTLYLLFANSVLEKEADMQYTTPYWLLWYLFATIVWNLVLPLVQGENFTLKKKTFLLLAAAAAAIFIGFDDKAGYYLSFSRIVEFFPYFLLGVYYRDVKGKIKSKIERKHFAFLKGSALLLMLCLAGYVLLLAGNVEEIRSSWLYGSLSYENGDYTWQIRLTGMGAALAWLSFFLLCMPRVRIPYITYIGAHTMPVYLLHGFVIKFLSKIHFFRYVEWDGIVALALSILLVLLLSWKPLTDMLAPLFRWDRRNFCRSIRRGGRRTGGLSAFHK